MDKGQKTTSKEEEELILEFPLEATEYQIPINIAINPDDPQDISTLSAPVPLFIKKLWKIVSDEANEHIITWNQTGDGFVVHDQMAFIAETLPRYFKHNQLSSFVRQLNLYDFHKVVHIEKDEFEFAHPMFLKEIPSLLPLIRRKTSTGRQRTTTHTTTPTVNPTTNTQQSPQIQELMLAIKDIKSKSDVITDEMTKLKQENATLWGEINSLRVKYSKQTKIINKLIHFLIAYMQKHHNSRKTGRTVSTSNSNKYLKTGPKIMEIDYKYKNNPHKFWSDFDNNLHENVEASDQQQAYIVVEPTDGHSEIDSAVQDTPSSSSVMRVSSAIEEILPGSSPYGQMAGATSDPQMPQFDYTNSVPSSSKTNNNSAALQRTKTGKENVAYLIDNSRVEMNTIKELLKNLTPEDMTTFYKLVNDNCKFQEDDLGLENENELISLSQLSPSGAQEYQDFAASLNNSIDKEGEAVLDNIIQHQAVPNVTDTDPVSSATGGGVNSAATVDPTSNLTSNLELINDDLLNTDDLLNNVSVEQYFNID